MSEKATQIDFLIAGFDNAKGGTVTAYAAGTTDLKTIWLDRDKATPAANPYTLNASRGAAQLYGDGIYKFVIKDSTGQVITGGTLDNIAIGMTDGPWIDVSSYASLTAAVAAIGSTETTLLIDGTTTVTANTVIPATLHLLPTDKALISHGAYTLTINSTFTHPRRQVFSGTGLVSGFKAAYPEWFGGVADGATDNAAAIRKAVLGLTSGGVLDLDSGTYNVASANQIAGWVLPASGILIQGVHNATKIVMTGTTEAPFFTALNKGRLTLRDVMMYGNSQGSGGAANMKKGSAFVAEYDTDLAADSGDILVEGCHFENFKSSYWVNVYNASGYTVKNINIQNNTFTSLTGNNQAPSDSGVPANMVNVSGNSDNVNGTVENVWVTKNLAEANYVKSFASVWVNGSDFHITDNKIYNSGVDGATGDGNPYAIYIYKLGTSSVVSKVFITNNLIANPYSCGIYSQGVSNIHIHNNEVYGQVDTVDTSLPRGGIALNGCTDVKIRDNELTDNAIHISVVGVNGTSDVSINGDTLKSTGTNSDKGIVLKSAGTSTGLNIRGITAKGMEYGIVSTGTSAGWTDVIINDNEFNNTVGCVVVEPTSGTNTWGRVSLSGNRFKSSGTNAVKFSEPTNNEITVSGNDFKGEVSGTLLYIGGTSDVTGCTITNNSFRDQLTAGFCLQLEKVQGTLQGNTFHNITDTRQTITSGTPLGYNAPTWAGMRGQYVQKILPTEAGSAASKYVIHGWIYDVDGTPAWKEDRRLTGN